MLGICNDSLTKTQEKYKLNLNLIKLGTLRRTRASPASGCNEQTRIQRTRGRNIILKTAEITVTGEQVKGGAVVRALTSRPGSNPGVNAIWGLSLLLVLSLAPRGFSPGTPLFPSPQKPTLPNSNSIWNGRTHLNEFI